MTRKTPVRHSVSSYKKKDGTVVHTFKRGSGYLNLKYARKRALHPSKTERYLLVNEQEPGEYSLHQGTIEITRYPEDPSHMHKYVNLQGGQGFRGVSVETLKKIAHESDMKHFLIREYKTGKTAYVTSELGRALDEQDRESNEDARKLAEARERWEKLPKEESMETVGGSTVYVRRRELPMKSWSRNWYSNFETTAAINHTSSSGHVTTTYVRKDDLFSKGGALMKKRVLERYRYYFDKDTPDDVILQTLIKKVKEAEEVRKEFMQGG